MTGGGSVPIRGKIGQKIVEDNKYSDAELSQMRQRVDDLTQELFTVKELGVTLSEKISQRSRKLSSLQHSLKKRALNLNVSVQCVDKFYSTVVPSG